MFCHECGNQMPNGNKFCPECGTQQRLVEQSKFVSEKNQASTKDYSVIRKNNVFVKLFRIILWILFWPIMLIIVIEKNSAIFRPLKALLYVVLGFSFLIHLIVLLSVFGILNGDDIDPSLMQTTNTIPESSTIINTANAETSKDETSTNSVFNDIITDDALVNDFINSCQMIGIDTEGISDFTQKDDWVGGPRFTFAYKGTTFILYCNYDSTVNSINIIDLKIYYQNYIPLSVEDYLVDSSKVAELQVMSENYVKSVLKYPDDANFPWFDWGFSRFDDIYVVSTTVTAKNALNVESDLSCYFEYRVTDSNYKLEYLVVDGEIYKGSQSIIPEIEREKLIDVTDSTGVGDTVLLVYGELGEYGKEVIINGEKYIWYEVPAGTYKVTSKVSYCIVFLDKDELHKNSDGYMESVNVETLRFNEVNSTQQITINENEHLFITINSRVELVRVD